MDTHWYLETVRSRLRADGFSCRAGTDFVGLRHELEAEVGKLQSAGFPCRPGGLNGWRPEFVAHKGGGRFSGGEQVFVVSRFAALGLHQLMTYLANGFAVGQVTRKAHKQSLGIFTVAVADDPEDLAAEEAEWGKRTEFGDLAGIPLPVIVDARYGQVHYFQELPLWGQALYSAFRKAIHKYLLPGA